MKITKNIVLYVEHRLTNLVELITITDITDKTIEFSGNDFNNNRRTLQYFYDTYTPIEIIDKAKDDFFEAELFTDKENLKIKLDDILDSIKSVYKDILKLEEKEIEEKKSTISISQAIEEEEEELEIVYHPEEGVTKLN